ncbi:hypothetical protein TCAL_09858 [Tigriopus californicus]|uniref:BLOC-2 complex member HPS3 N-terminal domain-containing protein n=1 Tax=Tigriopus californicus TaxID=6832 RepID=A0A553PDI1_TIGCA|nr:BLOC-2 complex member HPS3-like [Tigriopus californicus]TRY75729.1 hypothetical protein TCAL_09858 [Tigriopus californicus]|eukprot:TCALIF_09858-PA protein Name:"Similar to Hps3 Hermansky-Pudlak syndrome 3 protein homolog (Mus musculus)" AED:0.05 eAED:0.06 QI:0/-1/0/1/-1/1/1/0/1190
MVRMISVHHFSKQDTSECPAPSAMVMAGSTTLVLATDLQVLEVRDLEAHSRVTHSFQTIDRVHDILHCPVGNYLATLEGFPGDPGASVRVYLNWHDLKVNNAPIKPRIASHVTPSSQNNGPVFVDMIEFPQRDCPHQIAVCSSTGNLIVGAANLLIVYKFVTKVHEVTKSSFVDFHECFHVFHNFVPKEIGLCEDVIACLSANEIHVFKVKISDTTATHSNGSSSLDDERNLRSISVYSFTSDSEPNSMLLEGVARRSSISGDDTDSERDGSVSFCKSGSKIKNITQARQQDSENGEAHLEGYVGNVKLHPNHRFFNDPNLSMIHIPEIEAANRENNSLINAPKILEETLGPCSAPADRPTTIKYIHHHVDPGARGGDFEAECVTLVHCRLTKSEEGHDQFKNLNIKPVFWREYRVRKSMGATASIPTSSNGSSLGPSFNVIQHPLQSMFHVHLMSITTCFTSQNEGYLYHVPGHLRKPGKGCGIQRIATYPFTSPVGQIVLEPTLLHALTDAGLETFTLRSGYHTVLEAENVNNKTCACPLTDDNPICLVGLRPFIGAKLLKVSDSRLVILARNDGSAGLATSPLSLRAPTQMGEEVARTNKSQDNHLKWTLYSLTLPSHAGFHQDLMQLANMNKTISPQGYFQLLSEGHIALRASLHHLSWALATSKNLKSVQDKLTQTKENYETSCMELADYYLTSEDEQEWKQALPYYRMSGKNMVEILDHVKKTFPDEENSPLRPGVVHYVTEVVLRPTKTERDLDANLADVVIELLGKGSLETLAHIVLKSPTFRGFKTMKIFKFFQEAFKQDVLGAEHNAKLVLAFAVLSVDMNQTQAIHDILLQSRHSIAVALSDILIENQEMLLDTSSGSEGMVDNFSDLALLIRDTCPEMFMEVLVSLIKGRVFTLSTILQLFIGSFVSMSNIVGEATQNTAMLQLFLETYFTEELGDLERIQLDIEQEQAVQTLIRSYLTSLSVPVRFGDKNIDTDMFGNRMEFLDKLPPFKDDGSSAKESLEEVDSPEFWCQNSLLKLQSILCCASLALPSCKRTVLSFLEMYPKIVGANALRILSSDSSTAIPILAKDHPGIVLPYSKEVTLSLEDWQLVLQCLQDQLNSDVDHPMHEGWYSAMQEVLDHLAQTLTLDDFLHILPGGPHANEEFQGFIQMCGKNQQANEIQNLIVATGHKLLSTLTL